MKLKTIIYTTSRNSWIKRDFDAIYRTLKAAKNLEVEDFVVKKISLPRDIPTFTKGGTYIDWKWIEKEYPSKGYNAVCLHISRYDRDRIGLKHPNPDSSLGGVYNMRGGNTSMDFVVIANSSDKSYDGMTAFERIFIHELSHGFAQWSGVKDYTHTWDYKIRNIKALYTTYSFVNRDSMVSKILELTKIVAGLVAPNKSHAPLDAQWMGNVTQKFGCENANYTTTGHHVGTDYAVPLGEPCYALEDGEIVEVHNNHKSLGNAIHYEFKVAGVLHTARYMHLSYPVKLDKFKKGDIICHTGNTGMSTGPHLHIDVSKGKFSLAGVTPLNFRDKFVDINTLI